MGAAGGDGRSLVSGSVMGHTSVENNYLSSTQQAQMEKEYSECHDRLCKASTVAQWTAISLGQDGAFASGMIAGVPAAMYDAVEGMVKIGLSPVQTYEAIKSLIMSGDLVGTVADSVKQSYIERIDRLVTEYERAGASGSFKAGVEAGKLIADVLPIVTGGVGLAKAGVVLTEKVFAKAVAKKGAVAANATKAVDLPEPAPARSSIRLTEQQRLDKNLELFDNFTGGASRTKNAQITIDGQMYKANPELSKNAAVFDNVPQGKVMEYFMDLAGVEVLPVSKPMPTALDVYGNPGIRYTVKKGNVTYNLRSGSSSVDKTRAKWTIEIIDIPAQRIGGRVMERKKIEAKFR